jgi:Ran GTPase-activating protein (RanGAP) involved in mRNA processing and transport
MAIALSQGLVGNTMLRLLDMTGSRMDDSAVHCLCKGLGSATSGVEFLSLDFNSFGDEGAAALASMLEVNRSISELHLFGNRVTSVGAEHLAQALASNDRLQSLILSLNRIGDRGVAALARALTVNDTLANLLFPSNSIGHEGMEAFAEHLPRMNGLISLNVGMLLNCKSEEALTLGLKDNLRLSFLVMEKPVVDEIGEEQDEANGDGDGSANNNNDSSGANAVMDFYLRLNRSGRRVLRRHGTPPGLWGVILAKSSAHAHKLRGGSEAGVPDVLYHLLREIPELAGREERKVSTLKD